MAASQDANADETIQVSRWDGKKTSFSHLRKDVVASVSQPKDDYSWLTDTAKSLVNKLQLIQAECKINGTAFRENFSDHDDATWTAHLASREGGRIKASYAVMQVNVFKNTFGANFTTHTRAGFTDEEEYKEAKVVALEKYLKMKNKQFIRTLISSIFPTGCKKSMSSTHKEFLHTLLINADVTELLEGGEGNKIESWFNMPWLMPAVVIWSKILWRYEGMNENLDGSLVADFNDIADLGLGPNKETIQEVNNKLETLFRPVHKAFQTAEELSKHLRVCVLSKIIKTSAKGSGRDAQAWTLANNLLVSSHRTNTPVNMAIINNAITLAQKHLDSNEPAEETGESSLPIEIPESPASDNIDVLKAHIASQQKRLASLQTNHVPEPDGNKRKRPEGRGGGVGGRGGRRGGGAGRGGGQRPELKLCVNCGKRHPGDPPEEKCYHRNFDEEIRKLESLKKEKEAYTARGQQEKEDKLKKQAHFIEEINKTDDHYSVSHTDWTPELNLTDAEYDCVCLNVEQGACVDSGSPVDITSNTQDALTTGDKVKLKGVLDAIRVVEMAKVRFPTITQEGKPIIIETEGKGLLYPGATSKILSLSALLHAKYLVHFEIGTPGDPQYGGTITCKL